MAKHEAAGWTVQQVKGQAGSLEGNAATCGACGYVMTTSLSVREADRMAAEHIRWMVQQNR